MKNFVKLFILTVLTGIFFSCNQSFTSQKKMIELEGNPTTGFTWVYNLSQNDIVTIEEKQTYLGKDNVDGAPSKFEYTITSAKPGKTTLTFEYKRIWEDFPAEKTLTYQIEVDKTGKIVITE